MLETNARNGLQREPGQRLDYMGYWGNDPYYKLVSSGLVEMEEALKAEQVVDSVNGIQFWASATEVKEASKLRKIGFPQAARLLLFDLPGRPAFSRVSATLMMQQCLFVDFLAWSQVELCCLALLNSASVGVAYSSIGQGDNNVRSSNFFNSSLTWSR